MKERELKNADEDAVLESFKDHCSSVGKILEVKSRPDPPDAIVTIDGNNTWIEITGAWLKGDWEPLIKSPFSGLQ